jgi:hypothetical protein
VALVSGSRATAQEVCVKSGGTWVREGRDGTCNRR